MNQNTPSLSDLGLDEPVPADPIGAVMHRLDPDIDRPSDRSETKGVEHYYHPGVAAVLSLVIPGAGQLYRLRVITGLAWLFITAAAYALWWPMGLLLHISCVVMAAVVRP